MATKIPVTFKTGNLNTMPTTKEQGSILIAQSGDTFFDINNTTRVSLKDSTKLPLTGGTLTGKVNLNSNMIADTYSRFKVPANLFESNNSYYYVSDTTSILSAPFVNQWHIMSGFPTTSSITGETEYSVDGTSWVTDSTIDPRVLFGLTTSPSVNMLTSTIQKRRFVYSSSGNISFNYSQCQWVEIQKISGVKSNFIFTLEGQSSNTADWSVLKQIELNSPSGNSYTFWVPIPEIGNISNLRFTFEQADTTNPTALVLCAINLWTRRAGGQGLGSWAELPFTYDVNRDITLNGALTIPNDRTLTLGKFYNVCVNAGSYFKTNNNISHMVNPQDFTGTPFPNQWHKVGTYLSSSEIINHQYSQDGTTWLNNPQLDLTILFDQLTSTTVNNVLSPTVIKRRFTVAPAVSNNLTLGSSGYKWIQLCKGYTANRITFTVMVEGSSDNTTWTTYSTVNLTSNFSSTVYWIPINTATNYVRFTFSFPSGETPLQLNLRQINFWTLRIGEQGGNWSSELPFTWDSNRNITFPNNIIVSGNIIGLTTPSDTDNTYAANVQFVKDYVAANAGGSGSGLPSGGSPNTILVGSTVSGEGTWVTKLPSSIDIDDGNLT